MCGQIVARAFDDASRNELRESPLIPRGVRRWPAAEARRAAGKDAGIVRFEDGDFIVVADLPKRVEWNQGQLAAVVEHIRAAGDDPNEYVEVSYKVTERNYAAWPRAIREGFEPARTVRPGQLSIQLLADRGAE